MKVITSYPLIKAAYAANLPGCLNQERLEHWAVYLRDNKDVYPHFLATVHAASTPETLVSCNDFTPGSAALKQSITLMYNHYLPNCLDTARLDFWANWFNHPSAKAIDFVLTLQATATPETLQQCAAGG